MTHLDCMTQRLIVPVDGSSAASKAVDVALALAHTSGAAVQLVEVVFSPADVTAAQIRLDAQIEALPRTELSVTSAAVLSTNSVAAAVEELVVAHDGSIVVMTSHGRGRSAALVGSVAGDLLYRIFGPILLVGPSVVSDNFTGPVVVSVDGSNESEAALPLAAAWAIELGVEPWIVNVIDPHATAPESSVIDAGYPARLARELQELSHHAVEFEELHDAHPGHAVPGFAKGIDASLIVASSHGRTGLRRLTMGSVTAEFVRRAHCPVLVVRLPVSDVDSRTSQADATSAH
jgi:nucleotide-binding universal stress UspA family protein